MRYRRVFLVGAILIGFLLGLSLLVAVVLLGYGLPGQTPTDKQKQKDVQKTTQSALRKYHPVVALRSRAGENTLPVSSASHKI